MSVMVAARHKPIILASQSPRRAELLRGAGIAFESVSPRYDEPHSHDWHMTPADFAEAASYFKARSVAADYPDRLILGADTVVALDGEVFGKPIDREDARRILERLAGTVQEVITGVTLHEPSSGRRLIMHDVTRVTMRPMEEGELEAYLDSGQWAGKAGAYGIQDADDAFVECTEGSFSNVVGLPLELLERMMTHFVKQD